MACLACHCQHDRVPGRRAPENRKAVVIFDALTGRPEPSEPREGRFACMGLLVWGVVWCMRVDGWG